MFVCRTILLFASFFSLMIGISTTRAADQPAPRKLFQDSVVPLQIEEDAGPNLTWGPQPMMVQPATDEQRKEKMELLFSMALPDQSLKELEDAVAKGEVVSNKVLNEKYAPKPEDVEKLKKWLKEQGFEIVKNEKKGDPTAVYAKATAAQIEKSLQIKMVRVTRNGIGYTAAKDAPSLPTDIGTPVHAIIGLQPFRHMNKRRAYFAIADKNNPKGAAPEVAAGSAAPLSTASAFQPPFLVKEIMKAYGAENLSVSGKGQTIAILIDTFPDDSDLQMFWNLNGISTPPTIEKINVRNVTLPPREGEETLDVEWSGGVAPGATIRVYASGSLQFVALDQALDAILADVTSGAQPNLHQLSISLGLGETYMGGPSGEVLVQHNKYVRLNAAGVNVFVSSGDAGSNPDPTGHNPSGPLQAEFASSDTAVTSVGGSTLQLNAHGGVISEIGWVGSGGGKSRFFPKPSWQQGTGVLNISQRQVPDVCCVADPDTGALVCFQGGQLQYGGTSWSAPTWAGFCALINEARVKNGKPPLGFINPKLYPLLGNSAFRDVTSGTNGAYVAGPGFDLVTGIGVPNMKNLIDALKN